MKKDMSFLALPDGFVIPDEEDNLDIDDSFCAKRAFEIAEDEWLTEHPQELRFNLFKSNLNSLKKIVEANSSNFFDGHLVPKMSYIYAISIMEGYLNDTARQLIQHDKILCNWLKEHGKKTITLNEAYHNDNPVKRAALNIIAHTTWHNTKQINLLFKTLLSKSFDFSALNSIVKVRHDIVHRDGKTTSGEEIHIANTDFVDAVDLIFKTIDRLQEEIRSIGIK